MNLRKPQYFINRELSWLEFNQRVLEEGKDRNNPLFERLKFMAIVSSNLDEFFMVRVASLKDQVNAGFNKIEPSGLTPKEQLKRISLRVHRMVYEQYSNLNRSLIPRLRENGINIVYREELTEQEEKYLDDYFTGNIYPVLTPMAVDSSRPFPLILNKSLNLGILLKSKDTERGYIFATVQVPSVLPRVIELTTNEKNRRFIFLEEVIDMFLHRLFIGQEIISSYPYRITRNADLTIDEEEAEDLLIEIEKSLKKRKWGEAIRLEVDHNMDERLVQILKESLGIHKGEIYYINGPIDLTFFLKIYPKKEYNNLKFPEYEPKAYEELINGDIFEEISKKDILLHHPYESFDPVIEFVNKAADDPNVLAIKQTLYRVSGDSPIVKALEKAAEKGKQVTVLVELKARFDEENNIIWAKRLERAGCHVIYGLLGLKTHAKITLIVRKEDGKIKRYVHLGTGNYNDITAKLYTDLSFFTCREHFGADASAVFNMLSGYSEPPELFKFDIAPLSLRQRFLSLIKNETNNAKEGKKARIIAKMNSLVDSQIIEALYEASISGVKIDLIVRGICCLRSGIRGVSDNIKVISIVGRFLEHSRIYYFYNDGDEKLYLSSADWMPRNLDRRVELIFPIEDFDLKSRILSMLHIMLQDTVKARKQKTDGKYRRIDRRGKRKLNSQEYFYKIAHKKFDIIENQTIIPIYNPEI